MICGIDEAGRGPVIGPMVVAGVKVNDDGKLMELGVKDSKRLCPSTREGLEEKIKDCSEFTLRVVSAEDIDSLRSSMTLNQLEADLFANVIDELCVESDTCYLDSASTDENKFAGMVKKRTSVQSNIISEHGADDEYPVVSAASILAKVERDRKVEEISEKLGEDVGSGYPSDAKTREFLRKWIPEKESLPPHTRKSWETCKELMNKFWNRSLDDF
ncbi:MAG: ribonuclease HII [Candidatus Thermoplasmatota archaeon]|nr:ribonuclease HII [Candidatus Thermoplasmatota archaeon]MBS3789405.1 ribonuclease HII [Candidatus Thermoplasmatota archaeon]